MKKKIVSNARILARKKNKSAIKKITTVIRRIIKLCIVLILLILIIFTLQKYGLIPEKYAVLISSFGEKVISNVNSSLDIKKPVVKIVSENVDKQDDVVVSNYDFEYKFWALSYADKTDTGAYEEAEEVEEVKKNEAYTNKAEKIGSGQNYVLPVSGKLVSGFGLRLHPIKKTNEFHEGVDLAEKMGTPIKAFYAGTIYNAGFEKTYGYYVIINHDGGLQSLYAHCSKTIVKNGQKVKAGDIIAYVGSTGAANGPHLHFEIIKNKVKTDPKKYLKFN